MKNIIFINLFSGIILIHLVWLITDSRKIKMLKRIIPHPKLWQTYILYNLIIISQITSALFFPWSINKINTLVEISGLLIFWIGIFIAIWAKLTMRQSWGPPGQHDHKRQDKLITSGPFAFSRNPIYVGLITIFFGMALSLRSLFIFLGILLFLHFRKKVIIEEKLLQKYFGKSYENYAKKIPRFV